MFYSLGKYILTLYVYMPGTPLSADDAAVKNAAKNLCLVELTF